MRMSARLAFGLALSALAPSAALAGGHAHPARLVRPVAPKVIPIGVRPVYAPPRHALYGPPRNVARYARRHGGSEPGFVGLPSVYQPAVETPSQAHAASSVESRPRAVVVTNYNGAPPLWQGDAGYVAQPVIYNVETVLRHYPLADPPSHIGK